MILLLQVALTEVTWYLSRGLACLEDTGLFIGVMLQWEWLEGSAFAGTVGQSVHTWLLQNSSHKASYMVAQGSQGVFQKTKVEAGKRFSDLALEGKARSITSAIFFGYKQVPGPVQFNERVLHKHMNAGKHSSLRPSYSYMEHRVKGPPSLFECS